MRQGLIAIALLSMLTPALAGCIGAGDERTTATDVGDVLPEPGAGIDEDLLTQPRYDVLPKVVDYVTGAVDDIVLYTEAFLPDGPGPWPTILINSPYYGHPPGLAPDELGFADVESSFREYFVPRGYAVVVADVRGTGNSEGCMDMMGAKEQADTAALVEWIAGQDWSDGRVGMYGVSYVGTTPHEAAIMAPEGLVTIVTVAGVTNQWRNMYQNGVPYEGRFYPLTYEVIEGAPPPTDVERGPAWAHNAADGACDQEEAIAHVSPGTYELGVYDDYWEERNLTRGAPGVRASVFYNQGFADRAVNPMESVHWFNELDVPKKAFFHQGGHQLPPRDDFWDTMHAWFDHWLKGIDNGVMDTPTVEVLTNRDTVRVGDTWPPVNATKRVFHLAPGELTADVPADGHEDYLADMGRNPVFLEVPAPGLPTELSYVTAPFEEDVYVSGPVRMHLRASVDAENTYFLADVYDVHGDEWTWLAEGWFNAHLHDGFDRSSPLTPNEVYAFDYKFEPREWVIEAGHSLGLAIHGHDDRVFPVDEIVTQNSVYYGAEGSWIEVPILEDPRDVPRSGGV